MIHSKLKNYFLTIIKKNILKINSLHLYDNIKFSFILVKRLFYVIYFIINIRLIKYYKLNFYLNRIQ